MRLRAGSIIAWLGCWLAVAPCVAATLVVDPSGGGYPTVQSAIDAATAGDDVLVRCGVYVENVVLKDGVRLHGERASCAILDGDFDGDVITVPPVTLPTAVERLTVRHGNQRAGAWGAGISVEGGSPRLAGNVIEDNGLLNTGYGVIVSGVPGDAPTITQNVIRGNVGCCFGGGILISGADAARVSSNLIAGNSAYYGGGIYSSGGTVVANNTIVDNDAWIGGGIASFDLAGLVISGNAIIDNVAVLYGGGVSSYGGGTIEHNDAFGNLPTNWDLPGGDPTGTAGNISADPLFVDRETGSFLGFEPRSTSPLVDAGTATWAPPLDLRGIPHALDGHGNATFAPDIGARENEGVSGVRFVGAATLAWDVLGPEYRVYRGDLETLRATGAYHQDPATQPAAAAFCFPGSTLTDPQTPASAAAFFYLVGRKGLDTETTLGFDSSGAERPATLACE